MAKDDGGCRMVQLTYYSTGTLALIRRSFRYAFHVLSTILELYLPIPTPST